MYNELIKRALWNAEVREIAFLNSLPESKALHSAEYNKKISSLINEEKKIFKPKRKLLVAIIAAILVFAMSVTAIAFSDPIRKLIIEIYEQFTLFTSKDADNDVIDNEFVPEYLPNGYTLYSQNASDSIRMLVYRESEKEIIFTQAVMSSFGIYDSENNPYEVYNIGNTTVYIFLKRTNDVAVWTDTKYRYTLTYPEELDFTEVEKIIESVTPL